MNVMYRVIFLFILIGTAAACSSLSSTPTPLPTDTPNPTATRVPTNTPSPTATTIPTKTPTAIPEVLVGTTPDGWQVVEIPITDVEFAIPSEWGTSDQVAGVVEIGKPDGWFLVTFEESIPSSRLQLYQFMGSSPNALPHLFFNMGIDVQIVDSGEIPDIPLYWANYGSVASIWVGSIVTNKGTIIIELTNSSLKELEKIARTFSFQATPLTLE